MEQLVELVGKKITVYCVNYIYAGTLDTVSKKAITLTGAKIIYDTGEFSGKDWKISSDFPKGTWNIMIQSIESFGILK